MGYGREGNSDTMNAWLDDNHAHSHSSPYYQRAIPAPANREQMERAIFQSCDGLYPSFHWYAAHSGREFGHTKFNYSIYYSRPFSPDNQGEWSRISSVPAGMTWFSIPDRSDDLAREIELERRKLFLRSWLQQHPDLRLAGFRKYKRRMDVMGTLSVECPSPLLDFPLNLYRVFLEWEKTLPETQIILGSDVLSFLEEAQVL
jgi:hypothetical protein